MRVIVRRRIARSRGARSDGGEDARWLVELDGGGDWDSGKFHS